MVEEEVDELDSSMAAGDAEVEYSIEATGAHQGRVEGGGAIGGTDDQDVVVGDRPPGDLSVRWQEGVDRSRQSGAELLPTHGGVEALQLDQELIDDSAGVLRDSCVD